MYYLNHSNHSKTIIVHIKHKIMKKLVLIVLESRSRRKQFVKTCQFVNSWLCATVFTEYNLCKRVYSLQAYLHEYCSFYGFKNSFFQYRKVPLSYKFLGWKSFFIRESGRLNIRLTIKCLLFLYYFETPSYYDKEILMIVWELNIMPKQKKN